MTTPGEWLEWSSGKDYKGWTLECGKLVADIRQQGDGSKYYLTLNRHPWPPHEKLETQQHVAEAHIVALISPVLPAYQLIEARVRAREAAVPRECVEREKCDDIIQTAS